MIVKHLGTDGRVRRILENVSSMHQHQGNSVVSVYRTVVFVDTAGGTPIPTDGLPTNYLRTPYYQEYPIALINLAPGELVLREEDESERS